MQNTIFTKKKTKNSTEVSMNFKYNIEFFYIVKDLLSNSTVQKMKNYRHHYSSSCYDHCLEVAYWSYLICKKLNLDYISAARAGILHDLFLYDWRHSRKNLGLARPHAFIHPEIALNNACELFELNDKEQDIILKHMWPVTLLHFPKYKESYIITFTDKFSALKSFYDYYIFQLKSKKIYKYAYIFFASIIFNFF